MPDKLWSVSKVVIDPGYQAGFHSHFKEIDGFGVEEEGKMGART